MLPDERVLPDHALVSLAYITGKAYHPGGAEADWTTWAAVKGAAAYNHHI